MSRTAKRQFGWSWLALLLSALVLGGILLSGTALGDTRPVATLAPVDQELLMGQSGQIALYVDNVQGLFAAQIRLTYAPSILDVTDMNAVMSGTQIGPGGMFAGLAWHADINHVDKVAGTVDYLVSLDSIEPTGVSGSGSLGVINFQPLQPGVCPFRYVEVILTDREGRSIPCDTRDGQVRVVLMRSTSTATPQSGGGATATLSPTPSLTATCCCPTQPMPTPTATQTPWCRVIVQPPTQEVLVGRAGVVDIRVIDAVGLYAVELHMTYDPRIITLLDGGAAPGKQVSEGTVFSGRDWHVDINQVDETLGTIDYVFALDSSNLDGVSGTASLARLNFMATQPGICPVRLVDVVLAQRTGESLTCTLQNGEVRVVSMVSTATPTPQGGVTPSVTPSPRPSPTSVDGLPKAQVYLSPSTRYLLPGATGWVDIMISDAPRLYAAWVGLRYAPRLQIIDSEAGTPGVQLEKGSIFDGKAAYVLANEVDTAAGSMIFGYKMSFTESATVNGGQLARIHVRGNELGVFPLSFDLVVLADNTGTSIDATDQGGQVRVALSLPSPTPQQPTPGGPTATPTVTPSPTTIALPLAQLYVSPATTALNIGGETDIEVRVRNVANLYSAEFHILYDPALVEILDASTVIPGVQISLGNFLTPVDILQNSVDTGLGRINLAISQREPTPGRNGEGVIARLRIKALARGVTPLALFSTRLRDRATASITHTTAGGVVAISTRVVIGHAYLGGRSDHAGVLIKRAGVIMATTAGDGGYAFACPVVAGATLALTAEYPGYVSASKSFVVPTSLTVDSGTVTLVAGDVAGPQIVVARAAGCPGASTVQMAGPSDNRINIIDLTFVSSRFGASASDANWRPTPDGCHPEWVNYRADVNGDGTCDIYDVVLVGNGFGTKGPLAW